MIVVKIFVANLHPPRKYILGWMAASLATFLLISLVVSVTVGTNMSQLNTLLHSKCEYSAIAQHSAAENTYYQYNAGISFTTAADSKTRFNAEVLMQTGEGHYSDAIYRNTTNLNRNGVAVSKNIADHYGLDVGNTIFSKHIVDGEAGAHVAQQLDVVQIQQPVGVVQHQSLAVGEVDELLHLALEALRVVLDGILGQHLTHVGAAGGVTDQGRTVADQGDRFVSALLEMLQDHDADKVADVQGISRRVDADVGGLRTFHKFFLSSRHDVLDHASPFEFLYEILHCMLRFYIHFAALF